MTGSGTDASAILDGFVITGGKAELDNLPPESLDQTGAGMLNVQGSPTLRNLMFLKNRAYLYGGDLLGNDSGAVALDNPTRQDNSYHVVSTYDIVPEILIDGVTVRGGNANGSANQQTGGGILFYGQLTLNNVTIEANAAIDGGGLYNGGPNTVIHDVRFLNNSADYGGGMNLSYSDITTISQSVFVDNHARIAGGGLMVDGDYYGSLQISATGFYANTSSDGGAMHTAQNTTVSSSVFNGNSAFRGGAITSHYRPLLIQQSTFTSNSAMTGTIHSSSPQANPSKPLQIHNSLLWNNTAPLFTATNTAIVTVTHSLVQGGYPGNGNLAGAPLLIDLVGTDGITGTLDDDLQIQRLSPVIDVGDNASIPADTLDADGDGDLAEAVPFDYAGRTRGVNGTVDMGAYEYHPAFISPPPPPTATYGGVYGHTFIAFTDHPTATYHLTAGALPDGLTLNAVTGDLAGTAQAAGVYTATVEARTALGTDLQQFTISVETAPLTVTATSLSQVAGAANPPLTVAYSGFVLGDSAAVLSGAPACGTSATSASPPGVYGISCSQGTLAASNYHFAAFVPGALTVTAATRTIFLPLVVR